MRIIGGWLGDIEGKEKGRRIDEICNGIEAGRRRIGECDSNFQISKSQVILTRPLNSLYGLLPEL